MVNVFGDKPVTANDNEQQTQQLYAQTGQLKVENDFLKKNYPETFS